MTPEELEAQNFEAQNLDAQITAALRGSTTDPTLAWLAAEMRTEPPKRLRRRIGRSVLVRRWSVVQVAAAVLGGFLFWHGISSITMARWISENIGEPYAPHVTLEGGLAMIAIGGVGLACLVRKDWIPVAALTAVPLGLAYGVHGVGEVTVFAYGAIFHITEGLVAIAFLLLWWRTSRYRGRRARKE